MGIAKAEPEVKRWLTAIFEEEIESLDCLSDNGGNHLFRGVLTAGSLVYYRVLPYEEEKWQVFSGLQAVGGEQLVPVLDLRRAGRLLVVKEGHCSGLALDIGLRGLGKAALALERLWLSVAGLTLELEALYAQKGILHLDIKPEHLRLDASGRLCLIDFGSAYGNTASTNLKCLPQQGSGAYVCRSRRMDLNAIGPHVDLFGLFYSLQQALALSPVYEATLDFELAQLIRRLDSYDRSRVQLYRETRLKWLEIFMRQYGHITNR